MLDVRAWVGRLLAVRQTQHGKNGEQLVADCPFPDCGAASRLYVAAETGKWTCFRCGRGGRFAGLVSAVEGRPIAEVIAEIEDDHFTLPAKEIRARAEAAVAPRDLYLPPPSCDLPEGLEPVGRALPLYLRRRGVGYKLCQRYGLGICTGGRYAGRIVLPAWQNGRVVWWQARATNPATEPRYLSPSASRDGVLWGYDQVVGSPCIVLVEGPFDVLRCAAAGVPAMALCGKPVSPYQLSALRRAGAERLVLMLDPDAARDAARLVVRLTGEGVDVAMARLARADPGDSTPDEIRAAVASSSAPTLRERLTRMGAANA